MSDTVILVNGAEPARIAEPLRARFPGVSFYDAVRLDDLAAYEATADVLMTFGVGLSAERIARMPNLKWVQALVSGTDRFPPALAARPDVLLTSMRGVHGAMVSEVALTLMLGLNRRVRTIAENQRCHHWERVPQIVLDDKTVCIIGLGVIGSALATRCRALGMHVIGVARTEREVEGVDDLFLMKDLETAVGLADYVVAILPNTPETFHIIDAGVLAAMKPSAFLVNIGRGELVDEAALIDALRAGSIGGAGLDVVEGGRLAPDSPLWDFDNVFITPWVGGQGDRVEESFYPTLEHNVECFLAGEPDRMINLIDR